MTSDSELRRSDFRYELPDRLIAQHPLPNRSDSRLMVLAGDSPPRHAHFRDIARYLAPGDLLVLNDTRVVPARVYAQKDSGGQAQLLVRLDIARQTPPQTLYLLVERMQLPLLEAHQH